MIIGIKWRLVLNRILHLTKFFHYLLSPTISIKTLFDSLTNFCIKGTHHFLIVIYLSFIDEEAGLAETFYGFPAKKEYSEKTAETIDIEVKRITDEAYNKARELIEHNRDNVERIAKALLKYETLDAEDVKIIIAGGSLDKPTVADLLAAEQAKDKKTAEEKK